MTDTITVGSRAHTAVRIDERTVIHGANHPTAVDGVGLTHTVDAETFRAWHQAMRDMEIPVADLVFEVTAQNAAEPVEAEPADASPDASLGSDTDIVSLTPARDVRRSSAKAGKEGTAE
jgi:hypothetical protein